MQKCFASQITPTPSGLTISLHRLRDFLSQTLLNLQAPRERIYDSWNLAQTDHFRIRKIRNVNPAEKRQHVMLAQTKELDILHHDHLVVLHRK